jgi:hypothetical protein
MGAEHVSPDARAKLRKYVIVRKAQAELPEAHPLGFYRPPDAFFASEVEAFEKAHPFISHEKARKPDGTLEDWGRVRYHHSHVDAAFEGWVEGRYSLPPSKSLLPLPPPPTSTGERQAMTEQRDRLTHHEQMLDAQAGCVPCKLCGGNAVITDAGVGAGYYIRCRNSVSFRDYKGCMLDERRLGGWAYNVMDWWNRLHTPAAAMGLPSPVSLPKDER